MTPSAKENQIAEEIVRNLPEPSKEPFFGNIPAHLFVLVGLLFAMIGWLLPQAIPLFIFILLYLVTRSPSFFWMILIFSAFSYFLPVIETNDWYCTECSALKVTRTTYKINTLFRFKDTAYSRWYLTLVEHPKHSWKVYAKSVQNAFYQEFEEKIEEGLPFPALELLSPVPHILEAFKIMPPQEAVHIFMHWEELYPSEEFKKAFLLWQAETPSFLSWLKEKNPKDYQKIQFILSSSLKPLPRLIFK